MKNGEIEEYLREKIKDKKGIKTVKEIICGQGKRIVPLDINDVKTVFKDAKQISVFSGKAEDFLKKVKDHHKIRAMAIDVHVPKNTTLDDVSREIEKITENICVDSDIVWGARIDKKAKKITFAAVMGY